jgi:hypothetical protein
VPDLLDCQADEMVTLIAVRVDGIEHPPPRLSWRLRMRSRTRESLALEEGARSLLCEHHTQGILYIQEDLDSIDERRVTAGLPLNALDSQATSGS